MHYYILGKCTFRATPLVGKAKRKCDIVMNTVSFDMFGIHLAGLAFVRWTVLDLFICQWFQQCLDLPAPDLSPNA